MKNLEVSNFSKKYIKEDSDVILGFIRNFKDDESNEANFVKLCDCIKNNSIAIPVQIQEKIDSFVTENLEPMIYEPETVFEKSCSAGYRDDDGKQHIDTREELVKMMAGYFEVIMETEDKWIEFAMKELHPYLIA